MYKVSIHCITEIKSWMTLNKLKFNDSKTELITFASKHNQNKNQNNPIQIGTPVIQASPAAQNLGITFNISRQFTLIKLNSLLQKITLAIRSNKKCTLLRLIRDRHFFVSLPFLDFSFLPKFFFLLLVYFYRKYLPVLFCRRASQNPSFSSLPASQNIVTDRPRLIYYM